MVCVCRLVDDMVCVGLSIESRFLDWCIQVSSSCCEMMRLFSLRSENISLSSTHEDQATGRQWLTSWTLAPEA